MSLKPTPLKLQNLSENSGLKGPRTSYNQKMFSKVIMEKTFEKNFM